FTDRRQHATHLDVIAALNRPEVRRYWVDDDHDCVLFRDQPFEARNIHVERDTTLGTPNADRFQYVHARHVGPARIEARAQRVGDPVLGRQHDHVTDQRWRGAIWPGFAGCNAGDAIIGDVGLPESGVTD